MNQVREGWGWWTVFELCEDYEQKTLKQIAPVPTFNSIIPQHEMTPTELQDHLQRFGSYLSSLTYQRGWLKSKVHALKEGLKTGVSVALKDKDAKKTITAAEGELFAENMTLADARKYQIEMESLLELVQGWIDAYEWAYNDISRLITLQGQDMSLQTGRHP